MGSNALVQLPKGSRSQKQEPLKINLVTLTDNMLMLEVEKSKDKRKREYFVAYVCMYVNDKVFFPWNDCVQ